MDAETKQQRAEEKAAKKAERRESRVAAKERRETRYQQRKAELDEKMREINRNTAERKAFFAAPEPSTSASKASFRADLEDYKLRDDEIRKGLRSWPVAGAEAEFESGAEKKRMTVTRVVGGGMLLGPAGALLGGLARKNRSKVYVAVALADGTTFLIESSIRDEKQAREFTAKVTAAGRHYAVA